MDDDFKQRAFPIKYDGENFGINANNDGMYLLDYFAAKAMQGLLDANQGRLPYQGSKLAEMAYKNAKAMMKERKKYLK